MPEHLTQTRGPPAPGPAAKKPHDLATHPEAASCLAKLTLVLHGRPVLVTEPAEPAQQNWQSELPHQRPSEHARLKIPGAGKAQPQTLRRLIRKRAPSRPVLDYGPASACRRPIA